MDYTRTIGRHRAKNMGHQVLMTEEEIYRLGTPSFPPRVWKLATGIFGRRG